MDTNSTTRKTVRLIAGITFLCQIVLAQTVTQPTADVPAWRKLGNHSVASNLAGPAGGPVDVVWFSPTDNHLFVRTRTGQVFETADFTSWTVSRNAGSPPPLEIGPLNNMIASPEPGAKVESVQGTGRFFSLGNNLQVSDDAGKTWINLTAYNREPVIGGHQHSVAVSSQGNIVVANDFGVWRSTDGGLSWSGLNADLPNLPIRRLLPSSSPGTMRAEVKGIGQVELPPAAAASHANWIPDPTPQDSNDAQRREAGRVLGTEITALARTATVWIAGSIDGRLWTASDNVVKNWTPSRPAGGRIETIVTGGEGAPHSALVVASLPAVSSATGPRLLRTIDDGANWDELSTGLPDGALHGVALDAAAGIVYIAGDRGVFTAHVDMNSLATVAQWQQVPGLPEAAAMDVRLDSVRNILYVALDGYGLYAAPAPHRSAAVRVLTAADQPAEAAAPGVLLHVQGNGLSGLKAEGSELALLTSSASSAQVQVPFEASGPTLALTVDSTQGSSRFALPLKPTAPSILVDGDGLPILVDAASGLTLDAQNMAHPGARIQVFAAGLGKVDPEWRAGVPAPAEDPPVVSAQVGARLNGNAVEVTRATLAPGYVGLYLVEVQLPGLVNAGAADFALVVNGEASNHVKILLAIE